ncbi:MAG: HTTM domain-containing protein [Planctomycetaceae bacterium]
MRELIGERMLALARWWRGLHAAWNRFWFSAADPAPLGIIRLWIGAILVYAHIVWGLRFDEFLGNNGWIDIETLRRMSANGYAITFWKFVPEAWQVPVHVASIAVLTCFWLGLFTRWTAWLTVLIVMSYTNRNPIAAFGLDQIFGILVLYLAIGPSGASWSLDSWRRRRAAGQADPSTGDSNCVAKIRGRPSVSANLAIRLIQLHLCLIYFYAGASKLQGVTWWTGEAIWNVIANREYQTFDLTWLAHHSQVIEVIAHVTILWELSFPALVWVRPLRPIVLAMGVLMHLGIGAFLGMWTFGLAMIAGYWAFAGNCAAAPPAADSADRTVSPR